jgi:dynein heavy chain
LNDFFTLRLYENVCRSLFEAHKLMFSLVLTVKILFGDKKMDADEWRYFLAGPTGQLDIPPNCTDWLGDLEFNEMYKQLAGAGKLERLAGIEKFFVEHHKEFQVIFDSPEPENLPLPGDWEGKLDYFQKMIIIKAVRPDKISLAVQNYVTMKIGK